MIELFKSKTSCFILAFHLALLVALPYRKEKPTPPKLHTLTVRQKPLPVMMTKSQPSKGEQQTKPAKAPPPPPTKPKKEVKKEPAPVSSPPPVREKKKTVAPQPKPKPVEAAPVKKEKKAPSHKNLQKSLQQIQESIAKIEAENGKMEPRDLSSIHDEYVLCLVSYLQEHVKLPDIGEVKVALTLRPDGSVEKMVVLSAESEKNKKRLEEVLPKLCFPGRKGTKETFVLTVCNQF